MNKPPTAEAMRAMGYVPFEVWDAEAVERQTLEQLERLRRAEPKLYRTYRRMAFEMRAELLEELGPGVDPAAVQNVGLLLLAKVAALAIASGSDPTLIGFAGTIATLAVTNAAWDTAAAAEAPPTDPPDPG